jgi:ABC-type Fe3+ transport system substrate-binding protein
MTNNTQRDAAENFIKFLVSAKGEETFAANGAA